jgi:hypothetical protein
LRKRTSAGYVPSSPSENDARHVFQALKNGAAYFVTADSNTILSHTREIESAFAIRVVASTQLVAELTGRSSYGAES